MKRLLGFLRNRAGKLSQTMDQYQEAIVFAEAGQSEQARELFHEEETTGEYMGKLLVIGRESTFSREIIDYALEMANRMSYEIVALNTAPFSSETFKIFSSSRKQLCRDFRILSEENMKDFKNEAEKLGVPFTHVVKFSEREQALEELTQEFKGIEFVISDTEQEEVRSRVEEGERPTQPIYVYSII